MRAKHQLSGQRFGRLVALHRNDDEDKKHPRWVCRCDCGQMVDVQASNLITGMTKSCGCYRTQRIIETHRKHGQSRNKSRLYNIWCRMRQRCKDSGSADFANYGGRGITVCERWDVFVTFASDVGWPPSPKHSLDREDVNGSYSKENCRWATRLEQANNTTRTRFIEFNGERRSLADWARKFGIDQKVLLHRINRNWPIERAFTQPVRKPLRRPY